MESAAAAAAAAGDEVVDMLLSLTSYSGSRPKVMNGDHHHDDDDDGGGSALETAAAEEEEDAVESKVEADWSALMRPVLVELRLIEDVTDAKLGGTIQAGGHCTVVPTPRPFDRSIVYAERGGQRCSPCSISIWLKLPPPCTLSSTHKASVSCS